MTLHDIVRYLMGARDPVLRGTSRRMAALNYPHLAEPGLYNPRTGKKIPGIPIGRCGLRGEGGVFYFEPILAWRAGLTQNVNEIVLGMVGQGKSSHLKGMIYLSAQAGFRTIVTDVKGEYLQLAKLIPGSRVLDFGPNSTLRINMLDPALPPPAQHELVGSNVVIAMAVPGRTKLAGEESAFLWAALQAARSGATGIPLLPDLLRVVRDPTDEMCVSLHRSQSELQKSMSHVGTALWRLTEGDLAGNFHLPTTEGIFDAVPLLVLLCKGLLDEKAATTINILNFLTQGQWATGNESQQFHYVIHDEVWDLARKYPGFLESIQQSLKLGSMFGIANTIVLHHLGDLVDPRRPELVKSLFSDSSIQIIYRQEADRLRPFQETLHLTDAEFKIVTEKLPERTALFKIDNHRGVVVRQMMTNHPLLRPAVETRGMFRPQTQEG